MNVTDDLLIFTSQKFEEDEGFIPSLGNDDENDKTDEILYKKQNRTMTVQLMSVAAIVMRVDEVSLVNKKIYLLSRLHYWFII